MSYSVSVKDLTLKFGAAEVLKNLNLDVHEGEFIVLLGPSGCGKSTLLNCLAGLLELTEGQIYIKGKNVTWAEPSERGIGMVFQSYALYPQMTVRGNLSFGLKIAGLPKAEIENACRSAPRRSCRSARFWTASPAPCRAVSVSALPSAGRWCGMWMCSCSTNPCRTWTPSCAANCRVEIKRLHNRLKNTMIYVTHDQIEALTLADRIAIMRGGIIQQLDEPHTIYNRPANLFVAGFIGSPAMNFIKGQTINGGKAFKFGDITLDLSGYEGGAIMDRPKAIIGLRPEHLTITNEAVPGLTFPAVVEIDEPMGADSLVWLEAEGKQLSVRVPFEHRPQAGAKVHLKVDIAKASLFDETNELRI